MSALYAGIVYMLSYSICLSNKSGQRCQWRNGRDVTSTDANLMCKISRMRMRICHTMKINTSYYSYCDSTVLVITN